MSRVIAPGLHIEWSPGAVRAVDVTTSHSTAGESLAEVSSVLSGHRAALVGVGRGHVFLKAARFPKAAPDDLRRILTVQIGQLFPLPPGELAFDFVQTDDVNADGCLTVVAAVRAQDLAALNEEFQKAGLRPARVLPVALGAAAVAAEAGEQDALVVERTPAGLAFDVVQGGVVRFSRLVVAPGSDPLSEARRTLAAAGAGELPLIAVKDVTLPGARTVAHSSLELLGATASHFALERQEDRERETKRRVAARTRFATLMMLSALLLAGLVWVERSEARAAVRRSEGVWAKELNKLRSIRDTETKKAQHAVAIQSALDSAFRPAQPLADVTSVLGDTLPASIWLSGLTVERGKPVQMRGTAVDAGDVARLVDTLGASPRFRDVKLVFANSARVDQTPVVQFSLTATAVGNLPMPAPAKNKKTTRPASQVASASRSTTQNAGEQP